MNKLIFLLLVVLATSSCSSLHILKECHPVEGMDDTYVCKNLKPWE